MSDDAVEKIKERIRAVDLIGEYIKLEKAGVNYKGLCPFHNEKTPSFMVNSERDFWYCFGCQKGGDVFSFLQDMEGLDFKEALERLAERAGIELPKFRNNTNYSKVKDKKQVAYEILELTTKLYQHLTEKSPEGKKAIAYLKGRGIKADEIKKFRIGYAPDSWNSVLKFLFARGYKVDDINQTGLLVEKENGRGEDKFYDRFRGRIMFPVIDVVGRVLGYSARVMPGGDEKNAKYINTSQTFIYDKSKVLYGLYQGKTAIKKEDSVIVVEGNMDVIASHQAGIENVVAVSGTALTEEQVLLLRRYTKNVKLCFDMDEAGQKATRRSVQICLRLGMEVEIILLGDGAKDVGDLVKEDVGKWQTIINKTVPVMDYFLEKAFENRDVDNVTDRKKIVQDFLNILKDVDDFTERAFWIRKLAYRSKVDQQVLTEILKKVKLKERKKQSSADIQDRKIRRKSDSGRLERLQERLLALFALCPEQLASRAERLDIDIFSGKVKEAWEKVVKGDVSVENYMNELATREGYLFDEGTGLIPNEMDYCKEWDETLKVFHSVKKEEEFKDLCRDLKKAEEEGDDKLAQKIISRLSKLSGS